MNRIFLLSILIGFLHLQTWSQSADSNNTYAKQLLAKGVVLLSVNTQISENDKFLLLHSNLNAYRKYKTRLKVQLERGPLIELWSIEEMLQHGLPVETEIIAHKKDELPTEQPKHELILKLNIGMGYIAKPYGERYN